MLIYNLINDDKHPVLHPLSLQWDADRTEYIRTSASMLLHNGNLIAKVSHVHADCEVLCAEFPMQKVTFWR